MAKAKAQKMPAKVQPWRKIIVSFGLVSMEVGLKPLIEDQLVKGHKYDSATNTQVTQQWIDDNEQAVPKDRVVTGYEAPNGKIVTFDKDEIARMKTGITGAVSLEFCDLDQIDSVYLDSSYDMWPTNAHSAKVLKTLGRALRNTGRAGVGTCCLTDTTKVLVFAWSNRTNTVVCHTCTFNANFRWDQIANTVGLVDEAPEPAEVEIAMTQQLVEGLNVDFEAVMQSTVDEFTARKVKAIAAKSKGGAVPTPKAKPTVETIPDLQEALKASLAQVSKKKPTGKKKVGAVA